MQADAQWQVEELHYGDVLSSLLFYTHRSKWHRQDKNRIGKQCPTPTHPNPLGPCLFCLSGMHPIILPILLHCASYNFPSLHSAPAHHLPLDHILYIHYFSLDLFFSGKEGGSEDYQIIAVNGSVTIQKKVH